MNHLPILFVRKLQSVCQMNSLLDEGCTRRKVHKVCSRVVQLLRNALDSISNPLHPPVLPTAVSSSTGAGVPPPTLMNGMGAGQQHAYYPPPPAYSQSGTHNPQPPPGAMPSAYQTQFMYPPPPPPPPHTISAEHLSTQSSLPIPTQHLHNGYYYNPYYSTPYMMHQPPPSYFYPPHYVMPQERPIIDSTQDKLRNSALFHSVTAINEHASLSTQQPLITDLIKELRKSKEEADWAKKKLAETIVLLGREDSPKRSPSSTVDNQPTVFRSTVSKQEKSNNRVAKDHVEEEVADAVDEEGDEYSDDFEDNPAVEAPASSHSPTSSASSGYSVRENPGAKEEFSNSEKENYLTTQDMNSSENLPTNPLRESLAHSLIASQEMFRDQLESLRNRIQSANFYSNRMQARMNAQWDDLNKRNEKGVTAKFSGESDDYSTHQSCPRLSEIKRSFDRQRMESSNKIMDLLTHAYPNMDYEEARRLSLKFD
mmetsp:Transcript_15033/g.25067  ORF Transcript_15033/g.25067 Transcript_15033/m.25067 type:complete len:483 (+) Transcript_15033:925-2373(+)